MTTFVQANPSSDGSTRFQDWIEHQRRRPPGRRLVSSATPGEGGGHAPGDTIVRRTLAAAAAAALVLGGCSAEPSRESATKVARPSEMVAVEGPPPIGRFYIKAGENSLDADLYQFRFSPRGQDRITTKARVTTLDGCNDQIVVSAAQTEVGLTDHIQEVRGGKLAP